MTPYLVPLKPYAQQFTISLSGITYTLTLNFRALPEWTETGNDEGIVETGGNSIPFSIDTDDGGWVLDIGDANNNPIVQGIPLVTGADLLAKYGYLGFIGQLWVQSLSGNPDTTPTYANLGTNGMLFYVTNP